MMGSTSIGAGPPAAKPASHNHAAHKHHHHHHGGGGASKVAGAKGGAASPPMKMPMGAAPAATAPNVAQESSKVAGAAGGAVGGVAQLSGGGGMAGTDMSAMLKGLQDAIAKLGDLIKSMQGGGQVAGANGGGPVEAGGGCGCGGTAVKGASGGAATTKQYVAMAAAPVATSTSNQKSEDSEYEQKVLDLVNEERRKAGLGPLTYNAVLDNAAEKHNGTQERTGQMAHEGIGDGDPGSRIRAEGFRNAWGENVAVGQTSPEQVVREWMASPGHRANILNPDFKTLGVSYGTGANGRPFWAQEFGA